MREFSVVRDCQLSAETFWTLKADLDFERWKARQDGQTCQQMNQSAKAAAGLRSLPAPMTAPSMSAAPTESTSRHSSPGLIAASFLRSRVTIWVNESMIFGPVVRPITGRAMTYHSVAGGAWLRSQGMSAAKAGGIAGMCS